MKKVNYADFIEDCVVMPVILCPVGIVTNLAESAYMTNVKLRYYLSHPNGTHEECTVLSRDYSHSCAAVLDNLFDLAFSRKES